MTDLALDLIGYLLAEPMITWCESVMAPMRRPWLYRGLRLAIVAVMAFKTLFPPEVIAVAGVFPYIILPMFFFIGSVPFKIIASFLGYSAVFASELLGMFSWYLLTGEPAYSYDAARANLATFFVMHGIHALVCIPCFYLMQRLLLRIGKSDGTPREPNSSLRLYALIAAVQTLALMVIGQMSTTAINTTPVFYYTIAVIAVACIVIDIILIVMAEQSNRMERSIEESTRRIAGVKEAQAQAHGEAEHLARMRHDLKNQLEAASILAEQGQVEKAEAMLAELREKL